MKTKILLETLCLDPNREITLNDIMFLLKSKDIDVNSINYSSKANVYYIFIQEKNNFDPNPPINSYKFVQSSIIDFEETELCLYLFDLYKEKTKISSISENTIDTLRDKIDNIQKQLSFIENWQFLTDNKENRILIAKDLCKEINNILLEI